MKPKCSFLSDYIASREESERLVNVAEEFIRLAEKYCMEQFETFEIKAK